MEFLLPMQRTIECAFKGMIVGFCAWILTISASHAEPLPKPVGNVILTISGDLPVTNSGDAVEFDLEMLRSLPPARIETSTPWTDGVVTFEGVSLRDLLDHIGIVSGALEATALNDYAIEIPVSDAEDIGPIIAYLRGGKTMPVREKGPLWIIYPFDDLPDDKAEIYRARSIWQLHKLTVLPE